MRVFGVIVRTGGRAERSRGLPARFSRYAGLRRIVTARSLIMTEIFPKFFARTAERINFKPVGNPARLDAVADISVDLPSEPREWVNRLDPRLADDGPTWRVETTVPSGGGPSLVANLRRPVSELLPNRMSDKPFLNADAVAVYRPWHFWGAEWGIYVSESGLSTYATGIAAELGEDPARIAPFVYRGLVRHELAHFAAEVAGTEIEDLLSREVFVEYKLSRFYSPRNSAGVAPLEEAVANFMELQFARHSSPTRIYKPPGYSKALAAYSRRCGPGYRDFDICSAEGAFERVVADLASLIAGQRMLTGRWMQTMPLEQAQVPQYWIGDPAAALSVGAASKTAGPPTILRFEKWVRKIGGECLNARGDHKKARIPRVAVPIHYDTGAGFLLRPEAKQIKLALELPRLETLYQLIAGMDPLPKQREYHRRQ